MSNELITKGVGQSTVPQDVAIARTKQYCLAKWHEDITRLSTEHRTIVSYVLHDYHGCTYTNISILCQVHRLSTGNDIKRAWFYSSKIKKFKTQVRELEDYILYNAKWLH